MKWIIFCPGKQAALLSPPPVPERSTETVGGSTSVSTPKTGQLQLTHKCTFDAHQHTGGRKQQNRRHSASRVLAGRSYSERVKLFRPCIRPARHDTTLHTAENDS